jgi:hypothetical protein
MEGNNAKGLTRGEFKHHVQGIRAAWLEAGGVGEPIWSWDNCRAHGNVLREEDGWPEEGITARNHLLLPPYSGDMHAVIENAHALLVKVVRPQINRMQDTTLPPYIEAMREAFFDNCTATWAHKTTQRLYLKVLPAILRAKGGWASRRER